VAQRPALRAALDQELPLPDAVPPELPVVGDAGARPLAFRRDLGGSRLAALGRLELEDAEAHLGQHLAALIAVGQELGDEVPRAEARLLLRRDGFDLHRHHEQVAGLQVALVLLGAVRGDDRGEARLVEQREELRLGARRRGRRLPRRSQSAHGPGLEHGGGRHDAAMHRGFGELLVHVDRVSIVHGVAPVTDHRLVHRVSRDVGLADLHTLESLELFVELLGTHFRAELLVVVTSLAWGSLRGLRPCCRDFTRLGLAARPSALLS
jgi:hypothetical protein